jgi:hypothetical protein
MIASISFEYTDHLFFLGPIALLIYAKGLPFWAKTAPLPLSDAYVSKTKTPEKLGTPKRVL